MPALTPYTHDSFKQYLCHSLRDMAGALGWTVANGDFDEPLNDALLMLDNDDVANFTTNAQLRLLRSAGKVAVWRAVVATTAGDYQFSADGGSYNRQQVHDHARKMVADVEAEASGLGVDVYGGYEVGIATITYHNDPYADYEELNHA